MKVSIHSLSGICAITISREYGCDESEIAARLAKRLEWQVIDHAIVQRATSAMGTSQEEAHDEHAESLLGHVLNCLLYLNPDRMFDLSEAAWYIFLLPLPITPFRPGRRVSPDRIREELIDAKKEHAHGQR